MCWSIISRPETPRASIVTSVHRTGVNAHLFGDSGVECYSWACIRSALRNHLQTSLMEAAARHAATIIDPKLLSHVAKGDLDAFGRLYDQSSVLLFTLACRILNDREEAARLLHDVYLEVWRKVARYDAGRGTPVAWLVGLTRTRAIERLRSTGSSGSHSMAAGAQLPGASVQEDSLPAAAATNADRELRLALIQAIEELPAAQLEAVEMAYYHG